MNGSETIRWLYDMVNGGKPQAFKCLIENCPMVTRTLAGMRAHQRSCHRVREQERMFEENANGRKNGHKLDGSHF